MSSANETSYEVDTNGLQIAPDMVQFTCIRHDIALHNMASLALQERHKDIKGTPEYERLRMLMYIDPNLRNPALVDPNGLRTSVKYGLNTKFLGSPLLRSLQTTMQLIGNGGNSFDPSNKPVISRYMRERFADHRFQCEFYSDAAISEAMRGALDFSKIDLTQDDTCYNTDEDVRKALVGEFKATQFKNLARELLQYLEHKEGDNKPVINSFILSGHANLFKELFKMLRFSIDEHVQHGKPYTFLVPKSLLVEIAH